MVLDFVDYVFGPQNKNHYSEDTLHFIEEEEEKKRVAITLCDGHIA